MKKLLLALVLLVSTIVSTEARAYGWAYGITYYATGYTYNGVRWVPVWASAQKTCDQQYYNFLGAERANAVAYRGWYASNSSGAHHYASANFGPRCW